MIHYSCIVGKVFHKLSMRHFVSLPFSKILGNTIVTLFRVKCSGIKRNAGNTRSFGQGCSIYTIFTHQNIEKILFRSLNSDGVHP